MSTPNNRESLNTNLETRFSKQKAGGAFDVKETLSANNLQNGKTIDAVSANGASFQSPNGFAVKTSKTQMKMAQTEGKDGLSKYVKNLDTRRYK